MRGDNEEPRPVWPPPADGSAALVRGPPLPRAVTLMVAYLLALDPTEHHAVILHHASWLLTREPTAATALLVAPRPAAAAAAMTAHAAAPTPQAPGAWSGASLLEPSVVRQLLQDAAPSQTLPILDKLLAGARDDGERRLIVAALIDACLDAAIAEGGAPASSPPTTQPPAPRSATERLLSLLREATAEEHERVLSAIERASATGGLHALARPRLWLLRRLGRHDDALSLLVDTLADPQLAYDFCADVSEATAADPATATTVATGAPATGAPATSSPSSSAAPPSAALFLQLLGRYVRPADGAAPNLAAANALLHKWPPSVPAVEALKRLPPSVPIEQVQTGVAALLSDVNERLRATQVHASLLRAVSLQTRAELLEKRSRRLMVREDTECVVCGRRIGTAAFAALPNSTFAHIGCAHVGHSP